MINNLSFIKKYTEQIIKLLHLYNRILVGYESQRNYEIYNKMNGSRNDYIAQTQKDNTFSLFFSSHMCVVFVFTGACMCKCQNWTKTTKGESFQDGGNEDHGTHDT